MQNIEDIIKNFVLLWAVIDPIGTIPVFIAVTKQHKDWEKSKIAYRAIFVAGGILVFFVIVGEILLDAIGVPLSAFQIAGGIVLFLFALSMIFGEGKPEGEIQIVKDGKETAIFPLAIPSIASPGAMMGVVLLTDNTRFSILNQTITTGVMVLVLLITLLFLLLAQRIHKVIGDSGASIISRVMGLILASVAANSVLDGIKTYFKLG
ncbi:MAG: MarC family protein [Leptospiraceae bacterium]|nr:MarC family protein [Leptospiraceae bacterium]